MQFENNLCTRQFIKPTFQMKKNLTGMLRLEILFSPLETAFARSSLLSIEIIACDVIDLNADKAILFRCCGSDMSTGLSNNPIRVCPLDFCKRNKFIIYTIVMKESTKVMKAGIAKIMQNLPYAEVHY